MQAGSFATADAQRLTSYIRVHGIERQHDSWSIARDLVGDLPEQVVAGGGISQATGTIVWSTSEDVTDGSLNPWNASTGWIPTSGQQVIIYVGDSSTWWIQFIGVIDVTTGDIGSGMQSSIVGNDDLLNRMIEHSTVFADHPPTVEGGDYCIVGMGPGYAVDRAMRACGFYATPPLRPGVVLSVPAQLSMWPEFGLVRKSTQPDRIQNDYGWWVSRCSATYAPYSASTTRATPVELTMMVSPSHAGSTNLDAVYGPDEIRLRVTSARLAAAQLNGVTVATLAIGPDMVVSLLVKGGVWTLRTASATATGTRAIPAGVALSAVRITGDADARTSGFQVCTPSSAQEFGSIGFVPSFKQQRRGLSGSMSVMRSYQLTPARDVISEISKATLSPFWIDEVGKARMISSDFLRAQVPAQTITTLDDITKVSWSMNHLDTRSRVIVKYLRPALSSSGWSNILLWQGSGETMEAGQTKAFFATEPSDEDWVESGNGPADFTAFNAGRGTISMGYIEKADGTWEPTGSATTFSPIQRIGTETILFDISAGALGAGKKLVLATPDDATNYSSRMRGVNMPILRGRGKVMWTETSVTSAIRGPSNAPDLIYDTGHWLSYGNLTDFQTKLADYIAAQVTTPHATITGMEVLYDPRRQLGDVVIISSPSYMGVELTVLIVGVRNSAGDSFTQSLDVRVISASTSFTTYAEHEAAYPDSLTYEQWRAIYPDTTTYDGFNADPLKGAS